MQYKLTFDGMSLFLLGNQKAMSTVYFYCDRSADKGVPEIVDVSCFPLHSIHFRFFFPSLPKTIVDLQCLYTIIYESKGRALLGSRLYETRI